MEQERDIAPWIRALGCQLDERPEPSQVGEMARPTHLPGEGKQGIPPVVFFWGFVESKHPATPSPTPTMCTDGLASGITRANPLLPHSKGVCIGG